MTPPRSKTGTTRAGAGFVRIIGGQWRGRRLPVSDAPGLRPSGDRARETLFNWLQPMLHGARCADLFAGTGALGFEAASRGAREVVLIEKSAPVAALLRRSAQALGAGQVTVVESDALKWLEGRAPRSLDLAFVDPPFDTGLAVETLERLAERGCLAAEAMVYVELPRLEHEAVVEGFLQSREKVVGDVRMQLLRWQGGD
jgi:16S rRNA (guanine966-N2)-methyltransferase